MVEVEGTHLGSRAGLWQRRVEWSRSDDHLYMYCGRQDRDGVVQVSVPGMQVCTGQRGLAA